MGARSRKLATLRKALKAPAINGETSGELLVVGWGSTRGAIEEAVEVLRAKGHAISWMILHFLSPLEPGLREIFSRFKRVMTVEINYADPDDDPRYQPAPRHAQLATLLRNETLCDITSYAHVPGIPLSPRAIEEALLEHIHHN